MTVEFTKMHGTSNDYVYIDCMTGDIILTKEDIIKLSDRHTGIGGDGVIFIRKSNRADGFMDMYNADGSQSAMCGNGVRCVGAYLYNHGYAVKDEITVDTPSGIKTLTMHVEDGKAVGATVDMGKAVLDCADIPVNYDGGNIDVPVMIDGGVYRATCVSMGNPHAVMFVDDVESIDLGDIGPKFEHHLIFPERVNAEFVRVVSDTEIEMRVWERGTGETLACGTGACAVVVAAVLKGYCPYDTPVTIQLRGGSLIIEYSRDGKVLMTGDANEVFSGTVEI